MVRRNRNYGVREERKDGRTGMRDFVYEIEFLNGNLVDLVHDVYATCVNTIPYKALNGDKSGYKPSRTSIKSSTCFMSDYAEMG